MSASPAPDGESFTTPDKYAPTGPEPPFSRIEEAAMAVADLMARSGWNGDDGGRLVTYYFAVAGLMRASPPPPAHLSQNDFRWAARWLIERRLASVVNRSPGDLICLSALYAAAQDGRPQKGADGYFLPEFRTQKPPTWHLKGGEELFARWRSGRIFDVHTVERDTKPPRKQGRPPADPKRKAADIKLYRDWKASQLTKAEFLRQRGIDADEGLAAIDRGRKHSEPGNNYRQAR